MTENNSGAVKYLDIDLMEKMCHKLAVAVFDTKDDPIAFFHQHDINKLDSALNLPKAGMVEHELYPTLIDKAVILYYVLNKNHAFDNGNKRISAASLMVFLFINNMWLHAEIDEIVNKTLYIAKSEMSDRERIIIETKKWIEDHLIPLSKALELDKDIINKIT